MPTFIGDMSAAASDWNVPEGLWIGDIHAAAEPPRRGYPVYEPHRTGDLQARSHEEWSSKIYRLCPSANSTQRIACLHHLESLKFSGELQASADNGELRKALILLGISPVEATDLLRA